MKSFILFVSALVFTTHAFGSEKSKCMKTAKKEINVGIVAAYQYCSWPKKYRDCLYKKQMLDLLNAGTSGNGLIDSLRCHVKSENKRIIEEFEKTLNPKINN